MPPRTECHNKWHYPEKGGQFSAFCLVCGELLVYHPDLRRVVRLNPQRLVRLLAIESIAAMERDESEIALTLT